MAPKCVKGGFPRGAKFIPNKYLTNISAKIDAFIRDVHKCLPSWHFHAGTAVNISELTKVNKW